jgi:urease accessory protein
MNQLLNAILAHAPISGFGDFYAGMLHPVTAMEHLIPLIVLSLLAGQQGKSISRTAIILVPLLMVIGGLAAQVSDQLSSIIWINRASFIVIGGLVAWAIRLHASVAIFTISVFSFTHGYENMAGISNQVVFLVFTAGMMMCGLLLISIFSAVTTRLTRNWQQIGIRVVGSWTAAIGLLIVGLQVMK